MPLYESSERPVGAVDIDGVQEVNYDLFPVHFELIRRHASNLSSEVVSSPEFRSLGADAFLIFTLSANGQAFVWRLGCGRGVCISEKVSE